MLEYLSRDERSMFATLTKLWQSFQQQSLNSCYLSALPTVVSVVQVVNQPTMVVNQPTMVVQSVYTCPATVSLHKLHHKITHEEGCTLPTGR